MAHTICLVCLVHTVSGRHNNTLLRVSNRSGHITKLEHSSFLRYLCIDQTNHICELPAPSIFQESNNNIYELANLATANLFCVCGINLILML